MFLAGLTEQLSRPRLSLLGVLSGVEGVAILKLMGLEVPIALSFASYCIRWADEV